MKTISFWNKKPPKIRPNPKLKLPSPKDAVKLAITGVALGIGIKAYKEATQ